MAPMMIMIVMMAKIPCRRLCAPLASRLGPGRSGIPVRTVGGAIAVCAAALAANAVAEAYAGDGFISPADEEAVAPADPPLPLSSVGFGFLGQEQPPASFC